MKEVEPESVRKILTNREMKEMWARIDAKKKLDKREKA